MRDTPCAARGAEPLAFCSWRWGVAGRVDLPAEAGGRTSTSISRPKISESKPSNTSTSDTANSEPL